MAVVGRPRLIKSPEEFEARAVAYFDSVEGLKPTITGLALALGFVSRQSLYDYEKKPEFSGIVKWARLIVESGYEELLQGSQVTGPIFALKNMSWSDRHEFVGDANAPIGIAITRRVVDGDS